MIGNMEYKGYYISTTPDVGPNQGGYYCQVYDDEDLENQIDDFCIHPEELEVNPDIDYWIHSYIDGLVPNEGPSMNLK